MMLRVLGLDISALNLGYAVIVDGRLEAHGSVARGKGESDFAFACRVSWALLTKVRIDRPIVVYEVQRGPVKASKRKVLDWCVQQRGRLLQTLGVEGVPVQADNRPKPRRRVEMGLLYKEDLEGVKLNEHAADALDRRDNLLLLRWM